MNPFNLTNNRQKLILALILSLVLTRLLAPVIGTNKPQSPKLGAILALIPKLKLPDFSSQLTFKRPPPISTAPTTNNVFQPLPSQMVTAVPTITSVHLPLGNTPEVLPTRVDPTQVPDPTRAPRPTRTPRPTKVPTPTPLVLTNPRPGKNFTDAANIVGGAMCVPPAMIIATLEIEYGPWMGDVEANWISRNTYSGSDPHDNSGSTTIPQVAVMQMMEDTWYRIKPILAQKFGTNNLSLEVTFDSLLAGSYHLRNISLAMQDHVSCDDWPVKYILYGACRYNGACAAGQHTYNDYSYRVCENYNKYTSGPKKNCR